jgi:hypothetical protein
MRLTDEEVQRIRQRIEEGGITIQTLKEDLLDHLCCVVEIETGKGKSFDLAFQEAMNELAPNGLKDIQDETIFLLNPNNIIRMKKIMYLIGLLSSISIGLGWLFSLLHLTGASEMFNYGFLGFLLLFIPMLAFDRYKLSLRKALSEKLRIILGLVSAFLVGIVVAFKILHLSGADTMLAVGMLIFIFGFLPFLFFNMYRKSISGSDRHR